MLHKDTDQTHTYTAKPAPSSSDDMADKLKYRSNQIGQYNKISAGARDIDETPTPYKKKQLTHNPNAKNMAHKHDDDGRNMSNEYNENSDYVSNMSDEDEDLFYPIYIPTVIDGEVIKVQTDEVNIPYLPNYSSVRTNQ